MILLKSPEEIEIMRAANVIVAEVLNELRAAIRPGVSTGELDRIAEELARKRGAVPAFKGYTVAGRTFPASLCVSINDEVVHGIPSGTRVLREGDIVGLDFGAYYQGFYGDAAVTVEVGTASPQASELVRTTWEALEAAIEAAQAGRRLGDLSAAIQQHAESRRFAVVRDFVGHGIGKNLHEDPQVPNFGQRDRGVRLREGMVLAIEPMLNAGGPDVRLRDDGWTAVTSDGSLSAHFEHSVAIVEHGAYVLSRL